MRVEREFVSMPLEIEVTRRGPNSNISFFGPKIGIRLLKKLTCSWVGRIFETWLKPSLGSSTYVSTLKAHVIVKKILSKFLIFVKNLAYFGN